MRKLLCKASLSCGVALAIFCYGSQMRAQGTLSNDFATASSWQSNGSLAQLRDGAIPESTGGTIDPYFANLGATGWLRDRSKIPNVRNYIQWYFDHINPSNTADVWGYTGGGTIYNYLYSGGQTGVCEKDSSGACTADSTDAYAGTFLTLLMAAWNTGDAQTRQLISNNQSKIDQIGQVILATIGSNADGLSGANPLDGVKFLMDNCEDWEGLNALAQLFGALRNSRASTYQTAANNMKNGILSMWMGNSWSTFRDGLDHSSDHAPVFQYWYPDAAAQLFPVIHHVIPPTDANAKSAYQTLINTSQWQGWASLPWNSCTACDRITFVNDGSGAGPDIFPWTVVAYGMNLLGDPSVGAYVQQIEKFYVNMSSPYEPAPPDSRSGAWRPQENGYWMLLTSDLINQGTSGLSISSPMPAAQVNSPVPFSAHVTSGGAPITQMKVYLADTLIAVYIGNGTSSLSVNDSYPIGPGAQRLTAHAWDNATNNVYTGVVNFTVNSAPGVAISTPLQGAQESSSSPVVFYATATSAGLPITAMTVYLGNSALQTFNNTSGSTSFNVNTTFQIAPGSYTITANAWDSHGNLYQSKVDFTVQ
jgi:hypothetical protein